MVTTGPTYLDTITFPVVVIETNILFSNSGYISVTTNTTLNRYLSRGNNRNYFLLLVTIPFQPESHLGKKLICASCEIISNSFFALAASPRKKFVIDYAFNHYKQPLTLLHLNELQLSNHLLQ